MGTFKPRTRTRDTIPETDHKVYQEIFTNPGHVSQGVTQPATYLQRFDSDVMYDVVVPNFRKRIAQGEIINNPCSYERTSRESGGGSVTFTANSSPTTDFDQWGAVTQYYAWGLDRFRWSWVGEPSLSTSEDDLKARSRLVAWANVDSTPYAFGEDTLEIKETLRFLKNPMQGVLELTRSLTQKRSKLLRRRVKRRALALSDLWLEYQFAASPLYRSICDALDAYAQGNRALPTRLSSRGFAKDTAYEADTYDHDRGNGKIDSFDHTFLKELEYHSSILYEVNNPIRDWRFTLGFRMKDLPTTFWQVVPLSFMLDRVLDVSSFSKGIINMADPNVKILSAQSRRKWTEEKTLRFASAQRPDRTMSGQGDLLVDKYFNYDRQPWTPQLRDVIPKPNWSGLTDSATKILDLAALIHRPLQRKVQQR